ncbi:MAG: hypothetical protein K9N35_04985 [Candidatus Marinimicrobia bacterium]|nr:hypothetical protein [Candidatus Neomarinimicrobiota bacterium]
MISITLKTVFARSLDKQVERTRQSQILDNLIIASRRTSVIGYWIALLVISSCSILEGPEAISNPLDPSDPDFESPSVTFSVAPADGETVDTCYVSFEWDGNESSMSYSYRLDDGDWSEWSSVNGSVYPLLDEGDHIFEIKSRYSNGAEIEEPQAVHFTVDDLQPSSMALFPRYIAYDGIGDATVEIVVHEVTDVAIVVAVLKYDPAQLDIRSVDVYEDQSFLAKNGGTVIPFYSIDEVGGEVRIEVAVATGNPLSVSGSGAIARIDMLPKSVTPPVIQFDSDSEFRNADNTVFDFSEFGDGGVYAE